MVELLQMLAVSCHIIKLKQSTTIWLTNAIVNETLAGCPVHGKYIEWPFYATSWTLTNFPGH